MLKMPTQGNIQQIVKVLIGDTAVLQPGRRKTEKKARRARPKAGKKSIKKPSTKGGAPKPPKPPKPPKSEKPPGGNLPKAPEGFLSQVFGQPRPPQPFIQPIQPQSYFSPQTKTLEQQLLEAIKKAQTTAQAPTPQAPTPQAPTPQGPKLEAVVVPAQKTISRAPTVILPSPEGVFATPMTGSSIPATASRVYSANIPQAASRTLSDRLISESQAAIERAQSLRRALSQGPQPASNQANQPSVDVDGDGKEAEELQPQQPAVTFVQAEPVIGPYQAAQAASSNEVFEEAGLAPKKSKKFDMEYELDMDNLDEVTARLIEVTEEMRNIHSQIQLAAASAGGEKTVEKKQKKYKALDKERAELEAARKRLEPTPPPPPEKTKRSRKKKVAASDDD